MASAVPEPRGFEVERDGQVLAGEVTEVAEGGPTPNVVLLHAITASRRYVVHGSKLLPRRGFATVAYDARGHGDSSPAPKESGYSYDELIADVAAVFDEVVGEGRAVLAGSSMGAHTAVAFALRHPERLAGLVVIGPAYNGLPASDEVLTEWDELADGLESDGVEGFLRAYDHGLDPEWRDTLLRITRERLETHRHPEAVAQAMRDVPRDRPFEDIMGELEFLDVPALVVASHDDADPGHPYAVAEAYAQRLPQAQLVSKEPGKSPLSWQGGRLSREIAAFAAGDAVARRARG